MTNQNNQQPTTQSSEPKKTENIGSKLTGGLSWWLGSLMGKPSAKKVPNIPNQPQPQQQTQPQQVQPETASTPKQPAITPGQPQQVARQEDSISQDVQALKKLVGGFSSKVTSKVAPVVKEGVAGTTKAAGSFSKKVGPKFMTKILRVFFVIIFVIIVVFVAMKLFKGQGGGGGNVDTTPTPAEDEVTPTPVVYNPPKASVYASDESILKLEEDINVISREVSSVVLKETEVVPPTLDFNVTIK